MSFWKPKIGVGSFVGLQRVSPERAAMRLRICQQCPMLIRPQERCSICKCYMPDKVKWATVRKPSSEVETVVCPDNPPRWR